MFFQAEGAVHEAGRHGRAGHQLAEDKMADDITQEQPATLNESKPSTDSHKHGLGDLIRGTWESLRGSSESQHVTEQTISVGKWSADF